MQTSCCYGGGVINYTPPSNKTESTSPDSPVFCRREKRGHRGGLSARSTERHVAACADGELTSASGFGNTLPVPIGMLFRFASLQHGF